MGIDLQFTVEDARLIAALHSRGSKLVDALIQRFTYLLLRLQQKVQREYLTGGALQQRSGKLVNSVFVEYPTVEGVSIVGRVAAAGGPAWYGKVHEFGGSGAYVIYPVDKKALSFMMGGKQIFAKYVFHPPLPARPFMRPALEAMKPEIVDGLKDAVNEALRDG